MLLAAALPSPLQRRVGSRFHPLSRLDDDESEALNDPSEAIARRVANASASALISRSPIPMRALVELNDELARLDDCGCHVML